jgi:TRAP-type mannitol/chloroaromatic compound transport system permease small subunit
MLKRTAAGIDAFGTAIGRAVSLLIFVMIAIIAIEVVSRYFFNRPTVWVQDFSGWLQVAYIFLGAPFALRRGYFVRVDVLYERFGPRFRAMVDVTLGTALFACFAAVLIWKGIDFAHQSYRMGEVSSSGMWQGSVYPAKFLVPIGMILLSLAWLAQIIRQILFLMGHDAADEAAK